MNDPLGTIVDPLSDEGLAATSEGKTVPWNSDVAMEQLRSLNVRHTISGGEIRCYCPYSKIVQPDGSVVRRYERSGRGHDRGGASLNINIETGQVYCFGCKLSGHWNNTLAKATEGVLHFDDPTGGDRLRNTLRRLSSSISTPLPITAKPWGEKPYIRANGHTFPPEFLAWAEAHKWLETGYLLHRITLPVDVQGVRVGYVGRAIGANVSKDQRYMTSDALPSDTIVYPYDKLSRSSGYNHLSDRGVVLVEGSWDALWLIYNHVPALSLLGTTWTPEKRGLVRCIADKVWLMLDGDTAGQNAAKLIYNDFTENAPGVEVLNIPLSDEMDPGDLPAEWLAKLKVSLGIQNLRLW